MATSTSPVISAVEGNHQSLDGGAMFGNAPRALWERWHRPDSEGRIRLSCRALLVEADGARILFETGIGAFFEPKLAERYGIIEKEHVLLESLERLGLGDDDIDYVVLSHLHFDHAGGLLPTYSEIKAGHDDLLFPKAKYLVGKEAYSRAKNPHSRDRASFIPDLTTKLESSGRLVIVDSDRAPGIFEDRLRFFFTSGHTPGQMHGVFRGNSTRVVFAGDLIPGTSWVHLPITMGYDRFAEQVIDEKKALYERMANERWLAFYTHDPVYPVSRVELSDKGKYEAVDPLTDVVRLPI